MSWNSLIKGFKSYLLIERSLSHNSVEAYTRDVNKLADYASINHFTELNLSLIHI